MTRLPRPIVAFIVALLVAISSSVATADTLTVATYNVRNLFDVYDDPHQKDETRPVKPREELRAIAAAIREMDADVVVLQEIENEATLRAFHRQLLPEQAYRVVLVSPTNSQHGVHLGVLSRLPIRRVTSHRTLRWQHDEKRHRFTRDLLQLEIEISDEQRLQLFTTHFKSQRDGKPASRERRLAEAQMARQLINRQRERTPDDWILLAGDLNCVPDSPPLRHLTGGDAPLMDLHQHLPEAKRVTYLGREHRSTLDYLLADPRLAARLDRSGTGVLQDETLLAGSDHAPAYARFKLRDP
ncbi:MAG: endonuclease/exonuclease/phosphatase family protein [Phycisphaeraceae bacterium]|nr:endonuclease/exonuclease/phosphatase family protein [Phycisphaeraceae bacterium]